MVKKILNYWNTKRPPRIPFTKEGYENVKKEYKQVLEKRPEAVKTLSRARELGDLSENGLYKAARANLSMLDSRLRHLEMLVKNGVVAEKTKEGIVGLGSKVVIMSGEKTTDFIIVGRFEADPSKGKISNVSPIGRELIGKREGESINVKTPKGEIAYKIIKIINT